MFQHNPNTAILNLWGKITPHIKTTFFSSLFIGFLVHAFMMTHVLPNHDGLSLIIHDLGHVVNQGRWFLAYVSGISSPIGMPWVNGLLSIVYIAIAACLVVSSLKIYHTVYCILVAGLMVSMPSVACLFPYMQSSAPILFAMMLSCLAAFWADRYKYGFILAVVPLTLSLGCYQAFYGVTAGLMIIILIFEILYNCTSWQKTFLKSLRFLASLSAGMIFYFVMVRITMPSSGLTTYQNIDKMGHISFPELLSRISNAYAFVFQYFLKNERGFHFHPYMAIIFAISFFICGVLLVMLCKRQKIFKQPVKPALLILLFLLLPLGCNLIFIVGARVVHDAMIYGVSILLIFLLTVAASCDLFSESLGNKYKMARLQHTFVNISCWFITAAVTACLYNYFIFSNKAYLKIYFSYEQAYAQSVSLISHIQGIDGYTLDKEIVMVGMPYKGMSKGRGLPELDRVRLTGFIDGDALFSAHPYYMLPKWLNFSNRITHLKNEILNDTEIEAIMSKMPQYPNSGSIAIINDKIYVKFSYTPG